MSQNSKPLALSEEDAASIAALHAQTQKLSRLGCYEQAWQAAAQASDIFNRSTLKTLQAGKFELDDELTYMDTAGEYPGINPEAKGVHLSLYLRAESELTQKIIKLLEEDMREHNSNA